jgi:hypothetical protein
MGPGDGFKNASEGKNGLISGRAGLNLRLFYLAGFK